jgi:hypothetical protein
VVQVAQWEFADAMFSVPSDEFGDVAKLRKAGYDKQVLSALHARVPCKKWRI